MLGNHSWLLQLFRISKSSFCPCPSLLATSISYVPLGPVRAPSLACVDESKTSGCAASPSLFSLASFQWPSVGSHAGSLPWPLRGFATSPFSSHGCLPACSIAFLSGLFCWWVFVPRSTGTWLSWLLFPSILPPLRSLSWLFAGGFVNNLGSQSRMTVCWPSVRSRITLSCDLRTHAGVQWCHLLCLAIVLMPRRVYP